MTHLRNLLLAALVCGVAYVPASLGFAQERGGERKPAKTQRTPEERRLQFEQLFKRLDKNRNNVLKGDELPEKNPKDWLNRFDRNGDDEIRKQEYFAIVDRGPGLDRLFIVRDVRARANDALRQFDQDKDGVVTSKEYPGNKNTFKHVDRDRNGSLEWKELLNLASDELNDIRKKMKSPTRYEFLNIFDLNGDRKVSANEYDGPARVFRKFDENSDGTVGYYEIYPDRMMEVEARKPEPRSLNIISALDANKDRRVSREEFKGTPAAWKRLDRNKDGWITAADAR